MSKLLLHNLFYSTYFFIRHTVFNRWIYYLSLDLSPWIYLAQHLRPRLRTQIWLYHGLIVLNRSSLRNVTWVDWNSPHLIIKGEIQIVYLFLGTEIQVYYIISAKVEVEPSRFFL